MELECVRPSDIEKRSFEIIESEIGKPLPEKEKHVIIRVIHTTADFDYLDNLRFSDGAVDKALELIKNGAVIVTDTNMAKSGINAAAAKKAGVEVMCFMADEDVAAAAKENGSTRAAASVDKASALSCPVIYAVGNAPTALVRLCETIADGSFVPALVIGVPVGFVNVVRSKEMIMSAGVPYIVAEGRKGGSTVSAAICNALLYMAVGR